jgi:hypothetical protein
MKNELEFKGIDAKKTYLNETVNKLESKENHKKKK